MLADVELPAVDRLGEGHELLGLLLHPCESLLLLRELRLRSLLPLDPHPLAFLQLFRRGMLATKLNLVVVCQSLTNGMGDLWQVLARELRGWGAAQCGRFAAMAGVAPPGPTSYRQWKEDCAEAKTAGARDFAYWDCAWKGRGVLDVYVDGQLQLSEPFERLWDESGRGVLHA